MAKFEDLTQEQKDEVAAKLIAAGIPLAMIPKIEINLEDHLESD
mgnify:CR=1 FL=1|jgi:hypothetical protein|tara:strand:+ start:1045 stop:1176 length:132 start_codon:yes stop_codon:yes gene_type:complete